MRPKELFMVLAIFIGITVYMIGDHNVDLAWNMLRMSYYHGLNYELMRDSPYHGVEQDYDQIYNLGSMQKAIAVAIITGSAFLIIPISTKQL